MDIQISSNFERQIFECLNYDSDELNKIMNTLSQDKDYTFNSNIVSNFQNIYGSSAVSNQETLDTIREFNSKYNYLADPHTATGLSVLNKTNCDHSTVSLGCAHPSKFGNAIKKALGSETPLPEDKKYLLKKENIHILKNNTQDIKDFILKIFKNMHNLTILDNGLRIVTQNMPSLETVSMGIWNSVGGR